MNWDNLNTVLAVVAAVVGASTLYLRLFFSSELGKFEKKFMADLEIRFALARVIDEKFKSIASRIRALEERAGIHQHHNPEGTDRV